MDETKPQLTVEVREGAEGLYVVTTEQFVKLFGPTKSAEFSVSDKGAMMLFIFEKMPR